MSTQTFPFFPLLVSCLVAVAVIAGALRIKQILPMDHPNQRSLHETPIPRTGGIGIMAGLAAGWLLVWPGWLMPLLGLALALSALSLLDDFRGLPVKLRLGAQLAAAVCLVGLGPELPGGLVTVVLAVLAIAWMANLYNFMDGANGLAGGMAVIGFGFYALDAWLAGAVDFALAAGCVAAAALGFLLFNFDPARIFMGDAGSVPLGFLAAGLGLAGWQDGLWPPAFPLLVFSPFIADASVTLARRFLRGEQVSQPHREHYYQRLVRLGLGHRDVALPAYGLMLAAGLSALVMPVDSLPGQAAFVLAWLAVYAGLMFWVDWRWEKRRA